MTGHQKLLQLPHSGSLNLNRPNTSRSLSRSEKPHQHHFSSAFGAGRGAEVAESSTTRRR